MKTSRSLSRAIWVLLAGAGMVFLETTPPAMAQFADPVDERPMSAGSCEAGQRIGNPAGFEIDGNLIPCVSPFPTPPPGIPSFDWFNVSASCRGPIVALPNGSCALAPGGDFPFGVFFRDPAWTTDGFDPTTFKTRSNKNNDDISAAQGWNWGPSNGYPQKNDITEVYGTVLTEALTPCSDPFGGPIFKTWLILGAATRASMGD